MFDRVAVFGYPGNSAAAHARQPKETNLCPGGTNDRSQAIYCLEQANRKSVP